MRRMLVIVFVVALAGASPAPVAAEHVSVQASVGAVVVARVSSRAWRVEVSWSITCVGAGRASYSGNLNLVDSTTDERIYLGGVFSATGTVNQLVYSAATWRHYQAALKITCGDDATLHGSDVLEVFGGGAAIPPLDGDREGSLGPSGGGAGGGGTGGGGSGSGDPTAPARGQGCTSALIGTDEPDALVGTDLAEVIFGRGGNDALRGGGANDCLIGGLGNDALRGDAGEDRLTGGAGADTLTGGAGINTYDAGSGNDVVNAANGRVETVRCGAGRDRARVDRRDRVSGCERVTRVGR